MAFSFGKILARLNPVPSVGGLEISESALRYLLLEDGKLQTASLRLPPGIVENGRIKDGVNFVAALKSLRSRIPVPLKKPLHAVVVFPSGPVFAQAFSVPLMAEGNLDEAARLNLQMISPMDPANTYSDWQRIGETAAEAGGFELLGALIERKVSDDYAAALKAAGFVPVAAEFPALSLARLTKALGAGFDPQRTAIIINISSDGMDYAIVRSGNLYFNYFVSWRSIAGGDRQISAPVFKNSVVRNLQQVINFHAGKWGGPVKDFLLVSQGLGGEIKDVILKNFPDAKISDLSLTRYAQIPPVAFAVLGAALRGLVPRSTDAVISLLAVGTEDEYRYNQYRLFIAFWRNVVFASLSFLLALFLAAQFFLTRTERQITAQLTDGVLDPEVARVAELEEEARTFNRAVALVAAAQGEEIAWSPLLRHIEGLAARRASLTRIAAGSPTGPILISGTTGSEDAAIRLRRIFEDDPQIATAELPLSLIVRAPDGGFSFTITVTLNR